ncbi:beta-N-acetylhexosaminidase [Labilibaculum sp. DW002]|uniref:beta-N-acetylhexosaminidase n=1 Tax=Paralabilibaculum antarcticum TaxID=2912572 RepID=A0ABT5VMR5_9BACT|nr:family 20 glycosylhydrolase [Labilibaculum sp. DW002]MDE5416726.1 beta-N-acetylhexosaminidase [Labilibaculum sp. DW002]
MKRFQLFTMLLLLFLFLSNKGKSETELPLIPQTQQVEWKHVWTNFNSISIVSDAKFLKEEKYLKDYLSSEGVQLSSGIGKNILHIKLREGNVMNPLGFEGAYHLTVGNQVVITANNSTGIFNGIQTLKQLIRKEKNEINIANCDIKDWPAFKVRGFMHDVGRNYQSPQLLKEQIEVMAAYKYNVFHFHLTDDPGWRLESKIYPQLQSPEATSRKPGKYYTQEEFIDLVNFCADRHITLIPELDIPGHSQAFRKAFGLKSMNSPKVQKILLDLIDELCALVPAEKMPYIHLGTDEVRNTEEMVDSDFLLPLIQRVEQSKRKYISWWHGMVSPDDSTSVKQLWAQHESLKGHPFIDSRANYINHLDPLAGMSRLFYQQVCRQEHGDELALGGILCLWNDNRVEDERNLIKQNPVYPAMLVYSEAVWKGKKNYKGNQYWAQLPSEGTSEYQDYRKFEEKLIAHRDLYFQGKEFPYLKNAHIPWKIIGPFDHDGDMSVSFPVEDTIQDEYKINGKKYQWWSKNVYGGTVHLKHFFGFPSPVKEKEGTVYAMTQVWSPEEQEIGFWIGFHGWSRSGGRRGGPAPKQGQWHTTEPKIWVNEEEVAAPDWKQAGLAANTAEIPFIDEDYFYRTPSIVKLKKGWNKILLKVPHGRTSWKWMFTCIPVKIIDGNVSEVSDLRFEIL